MLAAGAARRVQPISLRGRGRGAARRAQLTGRDLEARARWDEYQAAHERTITETSTEWAPWYVVPADHNRVRDVAVATILVERIRALDPQFPPPDPGLDGMAVE
jgi:polyphosphate kinase 2 (PPK2 family)